MALLDREHTIISAHPTYYKCIVLAPGTNVRPILYRLQLLLTMWAGRVTFDILPDDVLLHIFHFDRLRYLDEESVVDDDEWHPSWPWHRLVHVCRRWRSAIFVSPNFLHLRLVCGPRTRLEHIGIWPPLPITIRDQPYWPIPDDYDFDAAIVHPDRVCEIYLYNLTSPVLQRLVSATQEQFPALIHLRLDYCFELFDSHPAPGLPDGFLGGSAPRLQSLRLDHIAFPALPKLLLSATDLVCLSLWRIPHSGYISPEAISTALAVLANLKYLFIGFESSLSRPDRESRRPPPRTRTVLPALTSFHFNGVNEYLEDLVARIDSPLLNSITIIFFERLTSHWHIRQLAQFMRRTTGFQELNEVHVSFADYDVTVLSPLAIRSDKRSGLKIQYEGLNWQIPSLAQSFPPFFPSMVKHLYIYEYDELSHRFSLPRTQGDIENMRWLEFFHPFTAVENLYVSKAFTPCIMPLQDLVGARTTEVLPTLQNIYLEGSQRSASPAIGKIVAARQFSGHPINVSSWQNKREIRLGLRGLSINVSPARNILILICCVK